MIKALHIIETGYFKLDGGAMFGVVPKSMWSKQQPADENNMCRWALRCLLIETDEKRILVDTGMGNKQDEKFRSFFHPHGQENLLDSLKVRGFEPEEITDVLLTHLHFDHCGGAVSRNEHDQLVPTFPNAAYWSNHRHWEWAMNPNDREKASFLKENFVPLMEHGVLHFIENHKSTLEWLPGIDIRFVYGHTEAMMLPEIDFENRVYVYCADLFPSSFHIPMPYVMSYDVRPLVTLQEKENVLQQAVDHEHVLVFEHDPAIKAATVKRDDRGRIILDKVIDLH